MYNHDQTLVAVLRYNAEVRENVGLNMVITEGTPVVSTDGTPRDSSSQKPPSNNRKTSDKAAVFFDPVEAPAWVATEEITDRGEVEIHITIRCKR